jgi:hypothetical protein
LGTAPWAQSSSGGYALITTTRPHAGSYSAYLGDYNSATESVSQQVTVPTNGTLTYWWYMTTSESGSTVYDRLRVRVLNTAGTVLATPRTWSNASGAGLWRQDTLSLAAFTVWRAGPPPRRSAPTRWPPLRSPGGRSGRRGPRHRCARHAPCSDPSRSRRRARRTCSRLLHRSLQPSKAPIGKRGVCRSGEGPTRDGAKTTPFMPWLACHRAGVDVRIGTSHTRNGGRHADTARARRLERG